MVMFGLTRKKPLKRSRKRIKARARFHAHGDNPLKTYRRRFTDYQVMVRANICRQQRLRNRTKAEIAFCEMLDSLGVLYESEAIFLNGDRFVLIDMYVKSAKVAFEIDGTAHDSQEGYDAGRDRWLLKTYGVRTIRIENKDVFRNANNIRFLIREQLELNA
jgi:hypothetical protein